MRILRNTILLVSTLLGLLNPVHSIYLPYSKIDSILLETWNRSFPVPYRKVLKKNINGKGILQYREAGRNYYIYTFLLAMPSQELVDREVKPLPEEREIIVKLFYEPSNKENPYSIRMGELDEEKTGSGFIRYVN